jgi:hypothetical protein
VEFYHLRENEIIWGQNMAKQNQENVKFSIIFNFMNDLMYLEGHHSRVFIRFFPVVPVSYLVDRSLTWVAWVAWFKRLRKP